MQRSFRPAITKWATILMLPVLIPAALIAGLWPGSRTVARTPEEVADFLRNFLEGTGQDWDWDDFESLRIADPELEAIRERAAHAAPPDPDLNELRALLAEAQAIARSRAA